MAFEVHTPLGLGIVSETDTVRGRKSYKVAGAGFNKWFDEIEVGFAKEADAFAAPAHPGDNHPDDPVTPFSHLGDEDPNYDPHAVAQSDGYDYSTEGGPGGDYSGGPGPHPDDLNNYDPPAREWQGDRPDYGMGYSPEVHRHEDMWTPEEMSGLKDRFAWAPVDHDNSVALPYDPTPQYPAIPGDTESTLQPIHEIDPDERLSPADSITFADRGDDESDLEPTGPNFARSAGWQQDPINGPLNDPRGWGNSGGQPGYGYDETEEPHYRHRQWMDANPQAYEEDSPHYQDAFYPHHGSVHEANPLLLLLPALEGAGAAGAGAGAAEGGMGALGGGLARGVGMGVGKGLLPGGGGDQGGQGGVEQAIDALSPGQGWGDLIQGSTHDAGFKDWLHDVGTHPMEGQHYPVYTADEYKSAYPQPESEEEWGWQRDPRLRPAGLSDKYIDITADADYHNDPVAQFRHDPAAYINRVGHVEDEGYNHRMAEYMDLVEASPSIREAAWADVRRKAMRLRREGRVHVKDVDTDRIYASVDGDNGTYDVMIAKGGAFGGFGGGHSITNWRCSCEWGKWAFKRQLTYVGRLCSHGYASYMEMQSAHTKGQPRQRRLHRPYTKRADALQMEPQRLVPEMVVNDTDDARQFLDVTEDERSDVGPDDVTQDKDIVHFARVMAACDREALPYPQELVAFLVRHADDQSTQDWKVQDTGRAGPALNEIRDWADTPQAEDFGHMEDRVDDIQDAVSTARDHGVDADQLVAFRVADVEMVNGVPTETGTPTRAPASGGDNGGGGKADTQHRLGPVWGGPISDAFAGAGSAIGDALHSDTGGRPTGGGGLPAAAPGQDVSPTRGENRTSRPGGGAGGGGAKGDDRQQSIQQNRDINTPGDQTGNGQQAPGSNNPGKPGGGAGVGGGGPIGQGDYKVQSGDTLSDIAQRSGYGGDYNSLAQQNNIADPNKINAGDTLNVGKPGGGGGGGPVPGGFNSGTGGINADGSQGFGSAKDQLDAARGADQGTIQPNPAGGAPPGKAGDPATTQGDQAGMQWGNGQGPRASDSPTTNAPGGPLNPNSGGPGADNANPALNNPPAPPTNVDTGAAGGAPGGAGAGGVNTDVATNPATNPAKTTDTSSASGGSGQGTNNQSNTDTGQGQSQAPASDMSSVSDTMGAVGDIAGTVSDIAGQFMGSRSVFADQADYDEWHKFAYPEAAPGQHKPFNGSGNPGPLEIGTSEEYADKARRKADDVTDLGQHDITEDMGEWQRQSASGGGIRRAGQGPRRAPVIPEVVREQRVFKGHPRQRVAEDVTPDDFDPLAPRTAASFEDPYAAEVDVAARQIAANTSGDIVAQFQNSPAAAALMSGSGSGGTQYDDFSTSPVFQQVAAMQRTAGRNYSLAEQAELIREGDRGGAGNLGALDLRDTHYEAEHSVGLFT